MRESFLMAKVVNDWKTRETLPVLPSASQALLCLERCWKSLLAWTRGRTVASASKAMSVLLTCLSTPSLPVCGKGGLPSPVHRMRIIISLEIPDLMTPRGKYCFRKSPADPLGRMSDLGCATDPVGTAAGSGQDVHGCYERLMCSQTAKQ